MKTLASLLMVIGLQAQNLPLAMVPTPDGKFVLVLDSGAAPGISVREIASPQKEISHLALPDSWLGLTFAPDKKTLYASGGARGSVFEIAYSPDGGLKIQREMKASDFVGDVALSPDGHLIYAADVFANVIAVINPQSGRVIDRFITGRRPYRIVFHPDGKSYFVSSWADAAVYQYNTETGEELGRIRLGPHTTDMILSAYQPPLEDGEPNPDWKYRLFVGASNTNNVFVVGIGENKTMNLMDTIDLAPEPMSPLGMTPGALALSRDQKELFVACSDANAVAVVDVSETRGAVEGFLQAGRYPSALLTRDVASSLAEHTVFIASGKNTQSATSGEAGSLPRLPPLPRANAAGHVIYIIHRTAPEPLLRAIAGIAPDFTVKLSHQAKFDLADPANTAPAGYLWTNALAAEMTVQNYGVFMKNGQAIDPPLRPFSEPDVKSFFEDLKEGEAAGDMPRLIIMQVTDKATEDAIVDAAKKSKFAASTEIVDDDLARVEALLGLRPMTRGDAIRP